MLNVFWILNIYPANKKENYNPKLRPPNVNTENLSATSGKFVKSRNIEHLSSSHLNNIKTSNIMSMYYLQIAIIFIFERRHFLL